MQVKLLAGADHKKQNIKASPKRKNTDFCLETHLNIHMSNVNGNWSVLKLGSFTQHKHRYNPSGHSNSLEGVGWLCPIIADVIIIIISIFFF